MNTILALASAGAGSSITFGEIIIVISLFMLVIANVIGKKLDNAFLSIVIPTLVTLAAGVLIAAAYPQKLLTPLYHITGGKLGIP